MATTLRFFRPFERFLRTETRAGTLLVAATLLALLTANSPWAESYLAVLATPVAIRVGEHGLSLSALAWINDFLMAVFFLLVGLEIKRELLVGELNSRRKAALPLVAALGGMVVPALLYLAFAGRDAPAGWGIPMATDIAFSIGVARVLGARVPAALLVFLTAFAIADDLGAVVVIALFYGHAVAWDMLAIVAALVGVLFLMNRLGVRQTAPYMLLGLPLWWAVHASGIHATIAGVLLGFSVPSPGRDQRAALAKADAVIDASRGGDSEAALEEVEQAVDEAQSPLSNLVQALHPYVAYGILPLFALANAGIDVRGIPLAAVAAPVTLGVAVGLILGKPVGILAGSWLAVKSGLAELPAGVDWRGMSGAGLLGGIGFTMSIFVAGLAFPDAEVLAAEAKLGILLGSGCAAALGLAALRVAYPTPALE